MDLDKGWVETAKLDFDWLKARKGRGGRGLPSYARIGQAERFIDNRWRGLPGGSPEPKWRDYLRRFMSKFQRGNAQNNAPVPEHFDGGQRTAVPGQYADNQPTDNYAAAGASGSAKRPPETPWVEMARAYAPEHLRLAKELESLEEALRPDTPGSDALRRLYHNGRLPALRAFRDEATDLLRRETTIGETRVAIARANSLAQGSGLPPQASPPPEFRMPQHPAHGNVAETSAAWAAYSPPSPNGGYYEPNGVAISSPNRAASRSGPIDTGELSWPFPSAGSPTPSNPFASGARAGLDRPLTSPHSGGSQSTGRPSIPRKAVSTAQAPSR